MGADHEKGLIRDRTRLSPGVIAFTPGAHESDAVKMLRGWSRNRGAGEYRNDGGTETWDFNGGRIKVQPNGDAALILGRVFLDSDPGIPLKDAAITRDRRTPGVVTVIFPEGAYLNHKVTPHEITLSFRSEPVVREVQPSRDTRMLETRRIARKRTPLRR